MIKISIAYARTDKEMLEEIRKQFTPLERAGKVKVWYDGEIVAGEKWEDRIQKELEAANIILLLISPDAIASSYFYENELLKSIDRHKEGSTRVIPVILRPCLWEETPIGQLQALPKDGKAISTWTPVDAGYFAVVEHIQRLVRDILWEKSVAADPMSANTRGIIHLIDSDGKQVEFEGDLSRGKANGCGRARSFGQDGYTYEGYYKNNLRHDLNAILRMDSGHVYEGEFRNDKREGKGKMIWPDGDEYEGDFLANNITGQGIYTTRDFRYEGEMKNGAPHKFGKMINYRFNYEYEGEFWEGAQKGKGKITYMSGWTYEGDFLNNQPHGKGKRTDEQGVIYEGEFRNGLPHGKGKLYTDQSLIFEGAFTKGRVIIPELCIDEQGNKLEFTDKSNNPISYPEKGEDHLFTDKECRLTFYSGEVFEGMIYLKTESSYSSVYDRYDTHFIRMTKGTFSLLNGSKLTISDDKYTEIKFANGATLSGNFKGIEVKYAVVFTYFPKIITYKPVIDSYNDYPYCYYQWPNGKRVKLERDLYTVKMETGELVDESGNVLDSSILTTQTTAQTTNTLASTSNKPKSLLQPPKRWWRRLINPLKRT